MFTCLLVCLLASLDELISKTLHVDQKKFYIDLKENSFGKFIKIIEVNNNILGVKM